MRFLPVKNKKIIIFIKIILTFTILFFLCLYLYRSWDKLSNYQYNKINYLTLSASFILSIISYLLSALGFNIILKYLGENLILLKGIRLWFYSLIARYIPATICAIGGRIYLFSKENVPLSKTSLAIVLESGFAIISGIFISLLVIPNFEDLMPFQISRKSLILLMGSIGILIFNPYVLKIIMKYIISKSNKSTANTGVNFIYRRIFILMSLYLMQWIIYGSAFYLFTGSFYEISSMKFQIIIGIHTTAYLIGFISFFAPSGLGVREGMLIIMLSSIVPLPVATIISLSYRIWITLVEISCIGLSYLIPSIFLKRGCSQPAGREVLK